MALPAAHALRPNDITPARPRNTPAESASAARTALEWDRANTTILATRRNQLTIQEAVTATLWLEAWRNSAFAQDSGAVSDTSSSSTWNASMARTATRAFPAWQARGNNAEGERGKQCQRCHVTWHAGAKNGAPPRSV